MELEHPDQPFTPQRDDRPPMPEPLPVRIIAVADVRLPANAGLEPSLDAFYVGILQFQRDPDPQAIIYHAENFAVIFDIVEGLIVRDSYRPLAVEVQSLRETEQKLIEAEIEYTRQKGLAPASEALVLTDPAGNWVEITEQRIIP
jgi:hypothetical protein